MRSWNLGVREVSVDAGLGVLVGVTAYADGPNLHGIGAQWPSDG